MKRSDLVRSIQVSFNRMREQDADKIITAITSDITDAITRGDRIEIRGFGRFLQRPRATKSAFNPRTGKPMRLAAGKTILFRPSNELTKKMN
ncbi:MAG: integration host factor subunit beta [Alphaproteobacteria bacterium]|nr:integration host factor subunit beta [Alphaproteobacteria bacterium]